MKTQYMIPTVEVFPMLFMEDVLANGGTNVISGPPVEEGEPIDTDW